MIAALESRGKRVGITATTGIAAQSLDSEKGRTIHGWSGYVSFYSALASTTSRTKRRVELVLTSCPLSTCLLHIRIRPGDTDATSVVGQKSFETARQRWTDADVLVVDESESHELLRVAWSRFP